jgi:hypothetical protein
MEKAGLEESHYTRSFGGILVGPASKVFGHPRGSRAKTRATIAALALAAASVLALPFNMTADDAEVKTFTVDVALGLPFFQNDIHPKEGQDVFSPGDTFIQFGNIYPKGTIPDGKTDFDPDTPGAIGKYTVRGTWTTDLDNFERAAAKDSSAAPDLAFATEMFSFGNDRAMILTDGLYPNAYFSAGRVVLGGTCRFRGIVGEVHEENIGENVRGFCNFRVTFRFKKAAAEHGR